MRETWISTMRHIAMEGRCFVLSCNQFNRRGDFPEDYAIEGPNAQSVTTISGELAKDPINVRYTEGIAAINEFSNKYYAPEGEGGGSKGSHTSSQIERAAEKLATEYAGVPEIEEIAKGLGKPTAKI